MFCTECGFKIEDGFKFCPKCGTKIGTPEQEDTRSEFDRIADEVYLECPNDQYKGMAVFRERTGKDLKFARDIMYIRYHGATPEQLDANKKAFKREKHQRILNEKTCPKCGSKHIDSYCEQGVSVTSKANIFGGMFITHHGDVNQGLKCMHCGYRWNPYKKK